MSARVHNYRPKMVLLSSMDTGAWLDLWLTTKQATPHTFEKYAHTVKILKESLGAIEIEKITAEIAGEATKEDQALRSVLSMALAQAVKAKLIKTNVAAMKREQRRPQEGSVYYRANRKAWVAQVTLIEPSGKRIVKTRLIKVDRKTKNPPDAAIRALEELKALKAGGGLAKGTSPISELMTEWLASIRVKTDNQGEGLAVRTFEQYESISRIHIIPGIGKIKVKELNRTQVDKWLRGLETSTYLRPNGKVMNYSANTLRLCRTVLGMALQWAMKEALISRNAAREARPPGGRPHPEKHALSEEDARRLIENSRGSFLGPLWALMITTGLRRGEALGLRWTDFDGESITVTSQIKIEAGEVVRGDLKTDKSRRKLRLPDFLIGDLEAHRDSQSEILKQKGIGPPDLIFTNSIGTPIRPDNLRKRFIVACKEAGIKPHDDGTPWGIHELRHTAATHMLGSRIPMQIVSRTLGHSSINVTMDVYSHFTDQDSEMVAASMNSIYGGTK